jgi:hypothetical protein
MHVRFEPAQSHRYSESRITFPHTSLRSTFDCYAGDQLHHRDVRTYGAPRSVRTLRLHHVSIPSLLQRGFEALLLSILRMRRLAHPHKAELSRREQFHSNSTYPFCLYLFFFTFFAIYSP